MGIVDKMVGPRLFKWSPGCSNRGQKTLSEKKHRGFTPEFKQNCSPGEEAFFYPRFLTTGEKIESEAVFSIFLDMKRKRETQTMRETETEGERVRVQKPFNLLHNNIGTRYTTIC